MIKPGDRVLIIKPVYAFLTGTKATVVSVDDYGRPAVMPDGRDYVVSFDRSCVQLLSALDLIAEV